MGMKHVILSLALTASAYGLHSIIKGIPHDPYIERLPSLVGDYNSSIRYIKARGIVGTIAQDNPDKPEFKELEARILEIPPRVTRDGNIDYELLGSELSLLVPEIKSLHGRYSTETLRRSLAGLHIALALGGATVAVSGLLDKEEYDVDTEE